MTTTTTTTMSTAMMEKKKSKNRKKQIQNIDIKDSMKFCPLCLAIHAWKQYNETLPLVQAYQVSIPIIKSKALSECKIDHLTLTAHLSCLIWEGTLNCMAVVGQMTDLSCPVLPLHWCLQYKGDNMKMKINISCLSCPENRVNDGQWVRWTIWIFFKILSVFNFYLWVLYFVA
jgi:hypothetical protein